MPERDNASSTPSGEEFKRRVSNILNDKCDNCPLANKLIGRAILDDGVIFEGLSAMKRFGGFLGSTVATIEPADCNEDNCLTPEQEEQLAEFLIDRIPYNREAAELSGQIALEQDIVSAPVDASPWDY